ncbi:MAG: hypothetical protein FJ102_19340 [Deltaproteobacteria bacterium]|nr:hypothetical protein [Deltaproteobacteria bacterium]
MLALLLSLAACTPGPDDSCYIDIESTILVTVATERDDLESSDLLATTWSCFEGGDPDIAVALGEETAIRSGVSGEIEVWVKGTWTGSDTGGTAGECSGRAPVTVEPEGEASVTVTIDCWDQAGG